MTRKGIGTLAAVSVFAFTGYSSGHHTATRSSVSADTAFAYELALPVVSPDGSHIAWVDVASVGGPERVFVARPDGRRARGLGPRWPDGISAMAWTRAGIVVESEFSVFLLSRTGRVIRIGPAGDITFSVGGSRVASGTAGCGQGTCAGPLVVIDIDSKKQWRLGRTDRWNMEPALSPDGKQVAWATPDGILVGAVSGGSPNLLVGGGRCPQWSPNGRSIAYLSGNNHSLHLVPASGGASQTLFKGASGCPNWSPDSTRIAFEPGRRLSRLSIVNVNTHRVHRASPGLGIAGYVAWRPDGSHLYVNVAPRPGIGCAELWLLRTATLRGKRLVDGCHLRR
jgi:Tol biopolymer transport system component